MKYMCSIFSLLLLLAMPMAVNAQSCTTAVCNAASPSEADFLAALPSSSNQNATVVVNIPTGTSAWSSGFNYTVPAAVTNLTIQGGTTVNCSGTAGTSGYSCSATDNTVLKDSISGATPLMTFNVNNSSTALIRFTGITMNGGSGGSGNSKYNGFINIFSGKSQLRYDHMHCDYTTYTNDPGGSVCFKSFAPITGVVDHSRFDLAASSGGQPTVQVYSFGISMFGAYNDTIGNGDGTFSHPTAWGASSSLYLENNHFVGGFTDDCGGAGAMVVRYNTMAGAFTQTHGTKSPAGPDRGCRSIEVYHNYISGPTSGIGPLDGAVGSKGATMLFWGNSVPSGYYRIFTPATDRSGGDNATETNPPNGWGNCGDAWDGNSDSAGYPCLDNVGRGQTAQNLNGANFPNRVDSSTGTISWPHQSLEPAYLFDNTASPQSGVYVDIRDNTTQLNRDVYFECGSFNNACSSFTGAAGTGSGPLANRPSSCTAGPGGTYGQSPTGSYGVAYWATDANGGNGELYVCTSTNTWTGIYQPYTYPHPLENGSSSTSPPPSPAPPTNLTGVVH
jgi:hypothetical protein